MDDAAIIIALALLVGGFVLGVITGISLRADLENKS